MNRLALETSPYLLQHASNPVDWYPWGEEALRKAREEDRPIFLSIGYSTCYWCHVMEKESFEDAEVAAFLNEHFVAIKVDREERPDLDGLYMTAVQLLTGRGGWPMTTILTPEGKPFYGATYLPKPRLLQVLRTVAGAWSVRRDELLQRADLLSHQLRDRLDRATSRASPAPEAEERGVRALSARFDERNGGFSGRPKFPNEPALLLLLDRVRRSGDPDALRMVRRTLDAMARGGIRDHIGGGFHRYSTDEAWGIPHFEKMLYNQAWLGRAYLEAWEVTREPLYRRVAEETLRYVARDMTSPEGLFYSAEDAGEVGAEGEFYAWRPSEIEEVLGKEDAPLFEAFYGVTPRGNFKDGTTVLHVPVPLAEFAAARKMGPDVLRQRLETMKEKMLAARDARRRPRRDDKVLSGWNGMMIGTLARAGRLLDRPDDVAAAERAAGALLSKMRKKDVLYRSYREGTVKVPAFQEDYAWVVDGLIELYDATSDRRWLEEARRETDTMMRLFWDPEKGGFFQTAPMHPALLARGKDPYDGAVPSGNSVAALDLARLARRTGEDRYAETAQLQAGAFAALLDGNPGFYPFFLLAVETGRHGEAGQIEYGPKGVVRASVRTAAPGLAEVTLRIRDGWHVQANRPGSPDLVPTELRAPEDLLAGTDYPDPVEARPAFAEAPLRVYEGEVVIRARLRAGGADPLPSVVPLELAYQACDDRRCLRPASLVLEVSARALRSGGG